MTNSQISFQSSILFINNPKRFSFMIHGFSDSVNRPWTAKEIVRAPRVFTKDIRACTAGGIITKSSAESCLDVIMFHIDPGKPINFDLNLIEDTILEKLDINQPLHAFMVGAKSIFGMNAKLFEDSEKVFENLEGFIKKLKIPYSKFKGSPPNSSYLNLAYNGFEDRITIFDSSLKKIDEQTIFDGFDDVFVSEKDKLV